MSRPIDVNSTNDEIAEAIVEAMSGPTPADVLAEALHPGAFLPPNDNQRTRNAYLAEAQAILAALAERGYGVSRTCICGALGSDGLRHNEERCPIHGDEPAGDLDAAWEAAEAALPEGRIQVSGPYSSGKYVAWAEGDGVHTSDFGPTPAAALHALAAQLQAGRKEP